MNEALIANGLLVALGGIATIKISLTIILKLIDKYIIELRTKISRLEDRIEKLEDDTLEVKKSGSRQDIRSDRHSQAIREIKQEHLDRVNKRRNDTG